MRIGFGSLEGIVKHNGTITKNIPFHIYNYNKIHNLNLYLNPHLESQIASISDDIAYYNHDIEDALRAKLISLNSLLEIKYFDNIIIQIKDKYKNIDDYLITYQMLRISISNMITDIINNSNQNILNNNVINIDGVFNFETFLISMTKKMKNDCSLIKDFLYTNVYNHPNIYKKKNEAKKIIMKLFEYFINNFNSLPDDWLLLEKNEKKHRIICDYISGMTDRYASKLYKSIYE